MSTATLEKLTGHLDATKAKANAAYRELVRSVVNDHPVSTDAAESILSAADKSARDLSTDVQAILDRRALHQQVQAAAEANREADELETRIQAVIAKRDADIQQAQGVCAAAGVPMEKRRDVLRETARRGQEAQQRLFATCPDRALVARYNAALARLVAIESEAADSRSKARDAATLRDVAAQRRDTDGAKEYGERVQRHEARVRELDQEHPLAVSDLEAAAKAVVEA